MLISNFNAEKGQELKMDIKVVDSILKISPECWNEITPLNFPFASYDFLSALEETHCLGVRTGWHPTYITCWEGGQLTGALILFRKDNSYGEYIFDFAWAEAFEASGLRYYPKYVAAIPFTPATGPKFLLAKNIDRKKAQTVAQTLLDSAKNLCEETHASSVHFLFLDEADLGVFKMKGYRLRHSFQYHWSNDNYSNFTEFLGALRGKRRKEILRERRLATEVGIIIQRLTGRELKPHHAELMYRFYLDTVSKMGGYAYLTPEFFKKVFDTMSERILLILATNDSGVPVAGALNFMGESKLYGRYWGCIEDYRFLHFELCYYQGIEFAIENRFSTFEAGAQGEHKFQRGFLPHLTYSSHFIQNQLFKTAVDDFIEVEKNQIGQVFEYYREKTPYNRGQ